MPPQDNSALRRRKVTELKRAITTAELRLKQHLERLELRKAAGQETAAAELLVRDACRGLVGLRHGDGRSDGGARHSAPVPDLPMSRKRMGRLEGGATQPSTA